MASFTPITVAGSPCASRQILQPSLGIRFMWQRKSVPGEVQNLPLSVPLVPLVAS